MNILDKLFGAIFSRILISLSFGFFFFLLLSPYAERLADKNLYYIVFGAIVQGFIGLVAFLGALAVFQLASQATDLSALARFVSRNEYPWTVLHTHKRVIRSKPNGYKIEKQEYIEQVDKELVDKYQIDTTGDIRQILEGMHENYAFEWEVRNRLMEFASISFLNVLLALIFLSLANILTPYWGFFFITFSLVLSTLVLRDGWILVRRVIGYA